MAGLTSLIEEFLKELLEESDGFIEIGRNDLAEQFGCAPSQINYVLTTRFNPYKGYCIESRRGGSGYVKIIKLSNDPNSKLELILEEAIGSSITKDRIKSLLESLVEEGVVTRREALLMIHATEDYSMSLISGDLRNQVRADILKNMLVVYLR